MEKKEYNDLVNKHNPQENKLKKSILAFISGGLLGVIGEIIVKLLMNIFSLSKLVSYSYLAILIILLTTFITALGKFDNFVCKFQCGLIIPTTGFAHSICSAMIDYKKDGFITGIGSNAFKLAGSVILYGVVSAFFFVILKVIIYG